MDHEPFQRSEQLMRDHQRTDGVVARSASGVADYMRIAFGKARVFCRIESRVHAGQDRKPPRGRQRELSLFSKSVDIFGIGRHDLFENLAGHLFLPLDTTDARSMASPPMAFADVLRNRGNF